MIIDMLPIEVPGQLATVLTVLAIAWYLWRAGAIMSVVASLAGSASRISILLLLFVAAGVTLGWIDFDSFVRDILAGVNWATDAAIETIREVINWWL